MSKHQRAFSFEDSHLWFDWTKWVSMSSSSGHKQSSEQNPIREEDSSAAAWRRLQRSLLLLWPFYFRDFIRLWRWNFCAAKCIEAFYCSWTKWMNFAPLPSAKSYWELCIVLNEVYWIPISWLAFGLLWPLNVALFAIRFSYYKQPTKLAKVFLWTVWRCLNYRRFRNQFLNTFDVLHQKKSWTEQFDRHVTNRWFWQQHCWVWFYYFSVDILWEFIRLEISSTWYLGHGTCHLIA